MWISRVLKVIFRHSAFIETLLYASLTALLSLQAAETQQKHGFTVRDDIEITQFGDIWLGETGRILVSPQGDLIVVQTTRGSLEDGKIHDELRIYELTALRALVTSSERKPRHEPGPLWTISITGTPSALTGALIEDVRWVESGRAITFLRWTDGGHRQLVLADVEQKKTSELTDGRQDILSYSLRDISHYVFLVPSESCIQRIRGELAQPFRVGTGGNSYFLIHPEQAISQISRGDLWAVQGGKASPVIDPGTREPVFLYGDGANVLSLSPDGKTVVAIEAAAKVPSAWLERYPPPYPDSAYRLREGEQDLSAPQGFGYAGEYVLISLDSGTKVSLTAAPEAHRSGWWEVGKARAVWSKDASSLFLPGTFAAKGFADSTRPCFAVFRVVARTVECIRPLKRNLAAGFEDGYAPVDAAWFLGGTDRIALKSINESVGTREVDTYVRSGSEGWHLDGRDVEERDTGDISVKVVTSFKQPPVLMVFDPRTKRSEVVYDPNPQVKDVVLPIPELYRWSDGLGHEWRGVLYKPSDFTPGKRYPLVIQNHGYSEARFAPSGGFPSAFIAQELAAAGMVVLQVRDCAGRSTPTEALCNVQEYETAVQRLSEEKVIDSARVGIIGFSRTVYYVMEALAFSRLHFRAASVTDGLSMGYADYLYMVGANAGYVGDQESIFGAPPIGAGLTGWLRNSPEFNLDRVTTPLRIVACGNAGINGMWEPYALLHRAQRPVDLVILNTDQHIITNPRVRFAAQEGNLDWFRFWLQDYEDPDPNKAGQYKRWRDFKHPSAQ